MTALSADRITPRFIGDIASFPVYQSTKIYMGSLVMVGADGYARAGANTAGGIFVGVAVAQADNSSGADGAINVHVYRRGIFEFVHSGLAIGNIGDRLYISDDQTVAAVAANVFCGVFVGYVSATKCLVQIDQATQLGTTQYNTFVIPFFHSGTVGAAAITLMEDCELPVAFNVSAAYAKCQTAPGGAYVCTVALSTAEVTITGAATKGEDETLDVDVEANTDFDVTIVDDNASASTATVQGFFVCTFQ